MADLRHREYDKRLRKMLVSRSLAPQASDPTASTALVIGIGSGICTVSEANGEIRHVRCHIPTAPGDEVYIRHEKVAGIAPRRTTLSRTDPADPNRERVIAANIDILVIVAAIGDPPFRPGLVDRYLVAAARGGIQPLLCINKVDVSAPAIISEATRGFTIPTVRCSARTGEGIEDLRALLGGNLSVLAGHSGVGKSSLLNALIGTPSIRTGPISEATHKGQHTTTSSALIHLGNHARVIDTPGIREFGLGTLSLPELRAAFPEFSTDSCRFTDCTHRTEPDCGIRHGSHPRYSSWCRLLADL